MKKLILAFILLLPVALMGQSIFISPTSASMWGKLPATPKVSVEYKNFEVVALYGMEERWFSDEYQGIEGVTLGHTEWHAYKGLFVAVFYKPVNIDFKGLDISGGIGLFNRPFPTTKGHRAAFTLQIEYIITKHISIRADHISNGFDLFSNYKMNPGLDNIGIRFHI